MHGHNSRRAGGSGDVGEPGATTATVALLVDGRLGLDLDLDLGGQLCTVTLDHGTFAEVPSRAARERQDRLDEARCIEDLTDPLDRAAFTRRNELAQALCGDG